MFRFDASALYYAGKYIPRAKLAPLFELWNVVDRETREKLEYILTVLYDEIVTIPSEVLTGESDVLMLGERGGEVPPLDPMQVFVYESLFVGGSLSPKGKVTNA
jgi:hypothetical protein